MTSSIVNNRNLGIETLVNTLKQQDSTKRDMVVSHNNLTFKNGKLQVQGAGKLGQLLAGTGVAGGVLELDVLDMFHRQTAERLSIPKAYYDTMLNGKHYGLLDQNVNYWFEHNKANYLVRTFQNGEGTNGVARALLSDRYHVIDNYDVLFACMKAIQESGANVTIEHGDITDKNMFVRFICPDIEHRAPELLKGYNVPGGSMNNGNPGIISGFVVRNSEVGAGTFSISPRAVVLACRNGMTRKDESFSKVHIGGRLETNTAINWSQETRNKNFELVMSQCKDAIKTFLSKDYLANWIDSLVEVGTKELEHPIDAIKNTGKLLNLSEREEKDILNYFIKGAQTTAFGISQAVTFFAHETKDAERQYELEMNANTVLDNIAVIDKPFVEQKKTTAKKATIIAASQN